jgi:hypothetical protein
MNEKQVQLLSRRLSEAIGEQPEIRILAEVLLLGSEVCSWLLLQALTGPCRVYFDPVS